MNSLLGRNTSLSVIFFLISLGLGYATLNRFDPVLIPGLGDNVFYADIVVNGPSFSGDAALGLERRLLAPSLAHFFYVVLPPLGSWNPVSVAMLFVNSIFCALSVVLIFSITYKFCRDANTSLIAGFLFTTSFFVTNSYLAGSIDVAYGFAFLLLFYVLNSDKWLFLPLVMILGCLSKEAFLPVASAIILFTLMQQTVSERKAPPARVALFLIMMVSGSATLAGLNYLASGLILSPTNLLPSMAQNSASSVLQFELWLAALGLDLIRFMFPLGALIVLSAFSLKKFPAWFLAGNLGGGVAILVLGSYVSFSGANVTGTDYARFIFSPAALLLSSASAMTISTFLTNPAPSH